ncbi:structural protein [Salinibacter phage M1EM-1]|uniref:Structural protein n=1 Tax=Salinibacter phage M1EM-1 TaxID=2681616 RepID=A0A2I6UFZ6_9CAUD|nr:structural protein [Salinibacter phage M1EM-1]AUO78909.1 structural protein [Salinibacter phage M1EM-1]
MSYGTKYRIEWNSRSGGARVDLQQQNYSGGVSALQAAEEPLTVTWGSAGGDDLTGPLLVSDAELGVVGDAQGEQLEELFDSGDREWRLRFEVDRGSGLELEWMGYVATDLWGAHPKIDGERISVEAIDGLALLENEDAYVSGSGEYVASDVVEEVLRGLVHDLPARTSMAWDSYDLDLAGPTYSPLDQITIPDTAYQEITEEGRVESVLSAETQLAGLCERFGLQLFQAGGEWWLRQRGQISDGSALQTWTMPTSGDRFGTSTDLDVRADLPEQLDSERPQSRVQRLRQLQSKYTYDELGELVENGDFEDFLNGWETVEPTSGDANSTVTTKKYNNTRLDRESSQENKRVARLFRDVAGTRENPVVADAPELSQTAPSQVYDAGPRAALRFSWEHTHFPTSTTGLYELGVGGYTAEERTVSVTSKALPSDQGEVFIDPLPASDEVVIPGGATVWVYDGGDSPLAKITLSEPARGGADVLRGDISAEIPSGASVQFYVWSSTNTQITTPNQIDNADEKFEESEVSLPSRTLSGEKVTGAPRFFVKIRKEDPPEAADRTLWLDNISLELTAAGEPIERTAYTSLDQQFGRSVALEHRVGSGPIADHPRGLFDEDSSFLGDWKASIYDGGSRSGLGLEELTTRRWMRQQRSTLDRRTRQVVFQEGERVLPYHALNEGGTTYTVTHMSRTWGSGNSNAGTIELTELRDDGVSGLVQAYVMESSGGGSGGSSGGTVVQTGGGGGVTSYQNLTGKPSGLLSTEGDSDDFPGTTTLLGGDGIDVQSDGRTVAVDDTVLREGDDITFENLTVEGNLYVLGEENIIDTETVEASDNLLFLNAGEQGAGITRGYSGLEADRGTKEPVLLAFQEATDTGRVGVRYRTLAYSSLSGGFQLHEEVVGQSSGAEGLVWRDSGGELSIKGRTGTFSAGETIEGQTSGATATLDSTSTTDQTQALATREDAPHDGGLPFWNPGANRFDTTSSLEWTGSALETSADVLHPQYTPELEKWAILSDGSADFRSIYADELRVDRFIAEVNESLAGEDFLTKSFAKLDEDWTVPQAGSSAEITLQNLPGLAGRAVFEEGDTVRLRYVDRSGGGLLVKDIWAQVTKPSGFDANGETQTWSATVLDAGGVAGEEIGAGSVALDYGTSGDHLIERSVLGGTFDRILRWEDTTGDGVPDTFETINYRGELSNVPKAKASGPGVYSSQARFDQNAIIGNLEAATSASTSGSYLKFTQANGLEVVVAGGEDVGTRLDEIQSDLALIAQRVTQEASSRAGLEITASETEAEVRAQAAIIGDDSQFSKSTLSLQASQNEDDTSSNASAISTLESKVDNGGSDTLDQSAGSLTIAANQNRADITLLAERLTQESEARAGLELTASETEARFQADVRFEGSTASVSLVANADGSSARLAGDSIILDGNTEIQGDLDLTGKAVVGGVIKNKDTDPDYTLGADGLTLIGKGQAGGPHSIDFEMPNDNIFARLFLERDPDGGIDSQGVARLQAYMKNEDTGEESFFTLNTVDL